MNFFEAQDRARRQSRRLVIAFALAVGGVVLAVDLVLLLAFGLRSGEDGLGLRWPLWSAEMWTLLASGSLATLLLIALASLVKIAGLRDGGSAVAVMLGGTPVPPRSNDLALQRYRGVVEEMAIASGVPVPAIFVLEQEEGINAFAAGYSTADAAVAVTRGALQRLNRDELQGVIAHEFSHILNGDMRLNLRLMGWLFGILVLTIGARKVLANSNAFDDSRAALAIMAFAMAILLIGSVGLLGARLIKAALSRQREYLADASAVQFTRQTAGLIGALAKIGSAPEGSKLHNVEAEEVSHMLFGDGLGLSSLFATHPPLDERIRALDPNLRPEQLAALRRSPTATASAGFGAAVSGFNAPETPPALPTAVNVEASRIPHQVGNPGADDYHLADQLQQVFPVELHDAAIDPLQAEAVLLALLLAAQTERRAEQEAIIGEMTDPALLAQVRQFGDACTALHPALRLPLAHLAVPTLRQRPRSARQTLLGCVERITASDGRQSLFEYCLGRLLRGLLSESERPLQVYGGAKLSRRLPEASSMLAVLAQQGHADAEQARRAFQVGTESLGGRQSLPFQPATDWAAALDSALPRLDQLCPTSKAMLLEAMVRTSSHDGRLSIGEAELLRTLCASLHMPLPAMLGRAV
jgi:Zn-dependent protease with chaperone function